MTVGWLRGEVNTCRSMQFSLLPLIRSLFCEVSPIPVKAALSMMGKIENTLRPPLVNLEKKKLQILIKEMQRLRILEKT